MEFQHYRDKGMEEEARYKFGLLLYTLDRLCKAVESHAKGNRRMVKVSLPVQTPSPLFC